MLTGITGNTEYHLDRGVHRAEPEGSHRELHLRVLDAMRGRGGMDAK